MQPATPTGPGPSKEAQLTAMQAHLAAKPSHVRLALAVLWRVLSRPVVQDSFLHVQLRDVSFVKPANFFLTVQLSLDSPTESPQFRTEVFSNTNQVSSRYRLPSNWRSPTTPAVQPKFVNNSFELPLPPNAGMARWCSLRSSAV